MKSDYREKFNRFFPALTGFVCFLFGFAGATLITGRVATVKYEALKAEFAEYKNTIRTFDPDSAYTLKFLPKEHRKGDGHWFGPVSHLTCTLQNNGAEWIVLENKDE